jgi:hypothetical protein
VQDLQEMLGNFRERSRLGKTMAAYIDLKPHMDVVTHHVTIAGDFEMTRSQWWITGQTRTASRSKCTITAWFTGKAKTAPDFIDHPFGADASWAVERPPQTDLNVTEQGNLYNRLRTYMTAVGVP